MIPIKDQYRMRDIVKVHNRIRKEKGLPFKSGIAIIGSHMHGKDEAYLTLDCSNWSVTLHGFNISGHNGDSYAEESSKLKDKDLTKALEEAWAKVQAEFRQWHLEKERQAEAERKRREENAKVEAALVLVLDDPYDD